MLTYLATLFELLEHFPEMVSAVISLKQLWDGYEDQQKRDEDEAKLKEALNNAKNSKDTTQLTSTINSILTGKPIVTAK